MQRTVGLVGLVAGGPSGVARYSVALTRALAEVAPEYPALRVELLTTRAGAERIGPIDLHVDTVPLRNRFVRGGPGRILLEQVWAGLENADLLHFFDLSGPVLAPTKPFVATIHDASVMHGYNVLRYAYKRRLGPWALRHASALVAISEYAKNEARFFATRTSDISVIHSGPGFMAMSGEKSIIRDFELGDAGYFLFVGNLTASKNLPFLVRAFAKAAVGPRLLLVGRPGEHFAELESAIRVANGSIRMVHDATDFELDSLYRGATALVLPSRYEGFAFTPLEAMSRGCPVLASDIPAVREVSGPGAMLLPLDDEAAWAEAMRDVARDPAARERLRARGRAHVAGYSWQTTARKLCDLFLAVST